MLEGLGRHDDDGELISEAKDGRVGDVQKVKSSSR
jgi:hypothetical protein